MKAFAAVALFALTACTHVEMRSTASDIDGVKVATAAWVDAYNTRDPVKINAAYVPDAVFWGTTSKTIRVTPPQIAEYFKDAAKRPEARVRIVDQNPTASLDMAYNAGSYVFSDVRDGQKTERPARFTMVFARRDGRWVLVHHHSSEVK